MYHVTLNTDDWGLIPLFNIAYYNPVDIDLLKLNTSNTHDTLNQADTMSEN